MDLISLILVIVVVAISFGFIVITSKNQKQKNQEELQYISKLYEDKIQTLNANFETQKQSIKDNYEIKIKSLNELYDSKEQNFQEKIELLENSKQELKLEFENLANKIFEENQKKSNTNLNQLLSGFKGQLEGFNKRVNDIYNDETKQRTSLLTEIKNLKELNNQIAQDAINLTKALKGDNKTQGDWGEMILSSILEQTGLREGKEYDIQGSFTDEAGKRLRPDVIVHLPSNKDIIIDSKVSLKAYMNYMATEDKDTKQVAAKELVKSVKAHIKGLSEKRYENIEGVQTLDFVLLFIPIEGAFLLATSEDENLFKTAFESNIMLVSASTLYVTLRTIENVWRNEHQSENAQLIAKKAADLYDKFHGFVKDMDLIGTHIGRTQKSYDEAMNKLTHGKGNLLRRSEEFIDLGVKPKKQIETKSLLEE